MSGFRELELTRRFLADHSLEWLALSGSPSIFYDGLGGVAAVSVEFKGHVVAPKPETVLGQIVDANDDGSIYARVRRPERGYWICYSRTGGENPIVTVTIQRINLNAHSGV